MTYQKSQIERKLDEKREDLTAYTRGRGEYLARHDIVGAVSRIRRLCER